MMDAQGTEHTAEGFCAAQPEPVCHEHLQSISGGDPSFIRELVALFGETAPGELAELEEALAVRDADLVAHWAHSLKGAARNMGAEPLALAAFALERAGRAGDLEQGATLVAELRAALERTEAALARYRGAAAD